MAEQEVINNQLKTKIEVQDEKFNMFMNEMRDRDNQRHAEMSEIRQSLQSIQDSGRNQTLVTFLGIAAMVVAVLLK